jgi:predicted nucleotide-binding protein
VVYELGAASKLWERRIIILREEGVNFPSDFKDLGYITFDGDDIATKGTGPIGLDASSGGIESHDNWEA